MVSKTTSAWCKTCDNTMVQHTLRLELTTVILARHYGIKYNSEKNFVENRTHFFCPFLKIAALKYRMLFNVMLWKKHIY